MVRILDWIISKATYSEVLMSNCCEYISKILDRQKDQPPMIKYCAENFLFFIAPNNIENQQFFL